MAQPLDHLRRSPLYRHLADRRPSWRALEDVAIADSVPGAGKAPLIIADLSPLPRLGFKGRGTIAAMQKRGVTVEATPNRAFRQADGGLCLVLAPGEVILLSSLSGDGARLDGLHTSWRIEDEERTYPLLRRDSHAWFAVAGEAVPEMFAKICGVDLGPRRFPELAIAQTSVAKMSAIIVRAEGSSVPLFHVLADSAAALYFCSCLEDAAHEFGGTLAGLGDIQALEKAT